jgi:hypothetical protein
MGHGWLRLGIGIERIQPGHPRQNGRHERMHLTLKKEATKPAAGNFLQQPARFDDFIEVFNHQRPHEALDMLCPAEVYQPSPRVYTGLPDIDYPFHDKVMVVTRCGRICLGNKKINFSLVFAGQAVGITADASLFRARLSTSINDLQTHVRPLSSCKFVYVTSNADWSCGLHSKGALRKRAVAQDPRVTPPEEFR